MVKQAFNALAKIHSRAATLKRPGSTDIYSACRVIPSNYFRFLEGPSHTVIRGREFVIPIDSMVGQTSQVLTFSAVPTVGTFVINYKLASTGAINYNAVAADVQTALRLIPELVNVTVTGHVGISMSIVLVGVSAPAAFTIVPTGLSDGVDDVDVTVAAGADVPWSPKLKRGDRLIHDLYGHLTLDEIIEMNDLGGAIMGYRVRTE